MTDKQILEDWYRFAAHATGFIGKALRTQREQAFLTQEQQRTIIGIQGELYDVLWLRLQAMPLPRANQFTTDLHEIVAKVQKDLELVVEIDQEQFEALIRAGQTADFK